ncbi:uncharacterized protein SOCEGT47_023520 [Sorangium cellulosum]|uniref:DUF3540 domain-containing protein n=1 Tax=Sorangium cellulosum TaxID=56 RepID=A0A4P2PZ27_SORCE|nr:DUF3540 domain-containing protein [Sorangium cellulosum]AUX21856.1 uncharacterized protein SOCEGT47_023520 [Sorangium cellulosum]
MGNEAAALQHEPARAGVIEATVVDAGDGARAVVRVVRPGAPGVEGAAASARIAVPGYRSTTGDRVLVAAHATGSELYIVGVLLAARGPVLRTAEGATASLEGSTIAIRDGEGALTVTYDAATGAARIAAPAGDLTLAAPRGKVVVDAATDVELRARRDVRHRAARRVASEAGEGGEPGLVVERAAVRVAAPAVDVTADRASLHATEATVLAERIATTAAQIAAAAGRMEIQAERLIERARDVYREVDGLLQTRAGRARSLIREAYQLVSERTRLVSKKETSIDGERVLLG